MSLSERIRAHRKKCGLSQEGLAERMGISRQAVTKWESGQSAPSTEHLFRLAEIFGTTVDLLLDAGEREAASTVEQLDPSREPEGAKGEARGARRKRNALLAAAVAAGWLMVYLLGRAFGTAPGQYSAMGWLLGMDPKQLSYLYGWLLHNHLFWMAMALSVLPALLGKYRFSLTTLVGFAAGLLLGELAGENPAGAPYGFGHYGWAIWGGIFLLSVVMGIVLEWLTKKGYGPRSKGLRLWGAAFLLGMAAVVILVRLGMPQSFGN